ncbi:MAG: hypothetical protein JSU99_00465 [Nitrospiraceae bacterium]|nr:MAG: hypothetical protein JSU99_00465 [Nitrospiraceae bacterium]
MSSDNLYEIQGEFYNPRFRDSVIEGDFMLQFNAEALKVGRVGIFILVIVWSGFMWFDLRLDDPAKSSALFFRLFIITPVFIAILAFTYTKYAASIYQLLAVISIFLIQASIVYIVAFYDFELVSQSLGFHIPIQDGDGKFIFILVWLLIIFMASAVMRLNVIPAVFTGIVYIFFNSLSIVIYKPSALFTIIAVPFLITALPVVWAGSLYVQLYARENYRSTKLLNISMQQSESLLLNILPLPIANRLKENPGTIADGFDSVSVLFVDIAGFTQLSEHYRPKVLVEMLNNIFCEFDRISKKHNVEKIKTIGDAYMLAAGIPEPQPDHCSAVAECALDMVEAVTHFSDPSGRPLQIRVGIHTGPAIAGVIGAHKFAYDVWGDTVNTASRMESHGSAGKIQATQEIYQILKEKFVFEPHGEIEVKGKGTLRTWWLTGRRNVSV